MVGQVDAEVRQLVILLMLSFAQGDGDFLAEVVLALAGREAAGSIVDIEGLRADLQALIARYRSLSLREIQLGPLMQEVTAISVRHRVRVPAALTLMGKAFAQMQVAAGELDPTLDPFAVAQSFVMRNTLRQVARNLDPKQVYFEAQKTRLRLNRMVEGIEGALGARPGTPLQVQFGGVDRLEGAIGQAGRRISLAVAVGGALATVGLTAGRPGVPRWVPLVVGGVGSALAAGLLRDRSGPPH
jgi:hypothetical protein